MVTLLAIPAAGKKDGLAAQILGNDGRPVWWSRRPSAFYASVEQRDKSGAEQRLIFIYL
jgi:hypothetical protein